MTRTILVTMLALLVAACDRGDSPPAATPPPPAPAPETAASTPTASTRPASPRAATGGIEVVAVDLGTTIGPDGRIASPSTRLPKSDAIHAVVSTEGRGSDFPLTARWTYNRQTLLGEKTEKISPDGPATTTFTITKPGGFPAGEYRVEISGAGNVLLAKEFAVE